jgi:hypothetical protein
MPKKDKKRSKQVEDVSLDSDSTESRPYVEMLREKFMEHHDPTIMLRPEERLSLEWRNISYRVPIIKKSCCKVKERTEKDILKDVTGYLPAGSLLVRSDGREVCSGGWEVSIFDPAYSSTHLSPSPFLP